LSIYLPALSALLFDPTVVHTFVESNFLIHLELLANTQFLDSLDNPLIAADMVVRVWIMSQDMLIRTLRNVGCGVNRETCVAIHSLSLGSGRVNCAKSGPVQPAYRDGMLTLSWSELIKIRLDRDRVLQPFSAVNGKGKYQ
jgi:hypothetical protein